MLNPLSFISKFIKSNNQRELDRINKIDYLEIRNENNLEITKNYSEARLFIALYISDIRIIDNFKLY